MGKDPFSFFLSFLDNIRSRFSYQINSLIGRVGFLKNIGQNVELSFEKLLKELGMLVESWKAGGDPVSSPKYLNS